MEAYCNLNPEAMDEMLLPDITRNILSMQCQRCGLVKNLNAVQRVAVGLPGGE